MATINLASKNPSKLTTWTHQHSKNAVGAKYTPREPKDGEMLVQVDRPQVGAYEFLEYAKGDMFSVSARPADAPFNECVPWVTTHYVVVAAKPGYIAGGEGWKTWGQVLVVRVAGDKDHAAVAQQAAAKAAADQATLNQMMDR